MWVGCSWASPAATGGLAGPGVQGREKATAGTELPGTTKPPEPSPPSRCAWEPRGTEKWGANEVTLQEQFPNADGLGLRGGQGMWVMEGGGKGQEDVC